MADRSAIEWTDATFNPWWGCRKVSPACDHCYAEAFANWLKPGLWDTPRRLEFSDDNWKKPRRWARRLPVQLGRRPRVFCASMADVFDNEAPAGARDRLWTLIRETPELDWLLLTKRIGNAPKMLPADWGDGYPNVWLGATVVTQAEFDRDARKLCETPARIRFLSIEPMLECIDLRPPADLTYRLLCRFYGSGEFDPTGSHPEPERMNGYVPRVDWIILGGESGPHARPFTLGHAKDVVRQCHAAQIAVFVKQLGARPVNREGEPCPHIKHRKGADPAEWPAELRVREFPDAA